MSIDWAGKPDVRWRLRQAALPVLVLSIVAATLITIACQKGGLRRRRHSTGITGTLHPSTVNIKVGEYLDGRLVTREVEQEVLVDTLEGEVELEMVRIPAGRFLMGEGSEGAASLLSECSRYYSRERCDEWVGGVVPQHEVTVNGFLIGRHELTQRQWRAVMGEMSSPLSRISGKYRGDDLPMVGVSWDEIQVFLSKLGNGYRLPTEAEWEYAARAGTTTYYAFGPTITPEIVNYNGNYPTTGVDVGISRDAPIVVGSLGLANRFGLYDMHGNVWEWCQDRFHYNYKGAPADAREWVDDGPAFKRVVRGGGWGRDGAGCRSSNRNWRESYCSGPILGFRLARSLP